MFRSVLMPLISIWLTSHKKGDVLQLNPDVSFIFPYQGYPKTNVVLFYIIWRFWKYVQHVFFFDCFDYFEFCTSVFQKNQNLLRKLTSKM